MRKHCYSLREILALHGTEEHLHECAKCRARYNETRPFLHQFDATTSKLGRFLNTIEVEKNVNEIEEQVSAIPEAERLAFLERQHALGPGMVLKLCARSRQWLLKSPNESERWLRLAQTVLQRVQRDQHFVAQDVQWTAAKVQASIGNLAVARGFLTTAHHAYEKAVKAYDELGDEYQVALFARGFMFTLTKQGRAQEAIRSALDALAVLRAYGARQEYLHTMINLAMVVHARAQHQRANAILDRLARALSPKDEFYPLIIHNQALVQMDSNRYDEALSTVDEWLALSKGEGLQMEEARAHIVAGEIQLLRGNATLADERFLLALTLLHHGESPLDEALLHVYRAKSQLAIGNHDASRIHLQGAITHFVREGFIPDLIQALQVWERASERLTPEIDIAATRAFTKARLFSRIAPTSPA